MISYFMSYKFYSNDWGVSSVFDSETDPPVHEQKTKYSWLIYLAFGVWLYIEIKPSWQEIIVYIYLLMSLVWNFKKIYTYYTKHTVPKMVHFSLNNF